MSSPQTTEDFYGILEADPSADDATIKANYKRLARLKHPDKRPGDPNATANFQKLQAAYETLINPEKRKEYDLLYPTICSQRSNSDSSPSRDSNSARPAGSTAPAWPAHEDRVEEMMKQTKDIFTNYKEEEIRWQKEDLESTEEQFEKEIDEILKNGRDQWFSWLGELDE